MEDKLLRDGLDKNEVESTKATALNIAVVDSYAKAYREYLLERGFMTLPQLIAFDVDVCMDFTKKLHPDAKLTKDEWDKISNDLYYQMLNVKDYVEGGRYITLNYIPNKS